jgi:hypothetical protein
MVHFDGHEVLFASSIVGAVALFDRTLPKGWARAFIHRQPVAAMATFWGLAGITLPLIIPPLRRAMKLPTNQYDADHAKVVFPKYI